ncbi:MAG: FAD-dependent monooxygenase [Thermoleophilia bacterium]
MALPRVAVIGGSLGGLTAAALLRDLGCDVDVYERTPEPLAGLGTGVIAQPELVRYLVERRGLDLDAISVSSTEIRHVEAGDGSLRGSSEQAWRFTSYDVLYRGLLDAFGRERYHLGHALVGLDQTDDAVELRFGNDAVVECDLAVAADGGSSVVRQRLLDVMPAYAGYVSWRGLVARDAVSDATWEAFDDRFTYGHLPDGHLIAYPIPLLAPGGLEVVGRQLNFQWYWNVPGGAALDELMSDRDGMRRPVSVHHHLLQARVLRELERRARAELCPSFRELLLAAEEPFVTVIADADTPRMALGRVALIGDAAITGRPHTGAGGAKAAADGWALADALAVADGDVPAALAAWEPARLAVGRALLAKVRRMGTALQHGGEFRPGDPANRWGLG